MRSSQRIRQTLRKYQRKPVTQQGILGNEVGEISVPNRTDYVYVRVAGLGTISIYNKRVPLILDLPVDVGYDPLEPKNFQVLNIHRYPQGGGRGLVDVSTILHGKTHNWAGIDPVYIEKRQLMPLRPTPLGGMQVYVTREVTYYDDKAVQVTGQQLDLSPYVPATGSLMVLIYKDTDELIKIRTGSILKDLTSLSLSDAPPAYPGTVPIALIRLYGGQSGIAEGYQDTDLIDVRQLFSPIDLTGTSSGGVVTGGHNIMDEGATLPHRAALNFIGSSVWAVDNAGQNRTDIIISGTSSGISTGTATEEMHLIGLYNYYSSPATQYQIGSVKSSDGRHWTKDLTPAIPLGAGGTFDDDTLAHPSVVNVNGVLYCYYGGYDGAVWKIGLARSFDQGATWVKYGMVLGPTQDWENNVTNEVNCPKVIYDLEETDSTKRFKMVHNGGRFGAGGIGYAYSADGLTWTEYVGNPILSIAGTGWESYYMSPGEFFRRSSDWVLIYASSSTSGGAYGVGIATAPNPQGLFTKSASNPILVADGITSAISVNIGIGDTQVTVADATLFPNGIPVWVYDSGGDHYLTHVVKQVSATVLLLADASPYALTVANTGTVRSVAYNSVTIEDLHFDGGYRVTITGFQPGFDSNTHETAVLGWINDDLSEGYIDYEAGLAVPISLVDSEGTNASAENMNYCDLWRDSNRFKPYENPNDIPGILTTNGDLLYRLIDSVIENQATAAKGATASANSVYSGYPASRAIDEDDATDWYSYPAKVVNSWLKVDLGQVKTITGWRMLQVNPITYQADARSYRVACSNDNIGWTTLTDYTVLAADETVNFGSPVSARYFRFTALTANSTVDGWSIFTLELIGAQSTVSELRRLPIGAPGTVLTSVSGVPSWESATAAIATGAHTIMDEGTTLPYQPVLNFIGTSLWAVNNAGQGRTDIIVSGTSSGGGHTIEDEGTPLTQRTNLNFVGASVNVTDDAGNDRTIVTVSPITGSANGHTIRDETSPLTQRANLSFKGSSIWAVDNPGDDSTDIIISGSAGSGDVSQYGAITAGHVAIFHADRSIEDGGVLLTGTSGGVAFHGVKAYCDTTQTINGTAKVALNQEEYDTDSYHDNVTNNTRITIPAGMAGYYLLEAGTFFASVKGGWLGFVLNNTTNLRGFQTHITNYNQLHTSVHLAEGDYVDFTIYTDASVAVGHASAVDAQSWFAATFLGA